MGEINVTVMLACTILYSHHIGHVKQQEGSSLPDDFELTFIHFLHACLDSRYRSTSVKETRY